MKISKIGVLMSAGLMIPAAAIAQSAPVAPAPSGAPAPTATAPAATAPAATPAATTATAPTTLAAGAKVVDTSGGPVGSIESVTGDYAVLATAKSKVKLPKASFAMGPNGPVIAMTAAQIDAAAAQAAPAQTAAVAKPNVTQGAAVSDMQGAAVGTVASVDGQFATVQLTGGTKVRLPINAFGASNNGGLKIAMTAQQLNAAAGASGAAKGGTGT